MEGDSFQGFNPYAPLQTHGRRLPHWQQSGVTYFVTWRLHDAVPQEKLRSWSEERRDWLALHPEPWSEETEGAFYERFPTRLEDWLDCGIGACWLKMDSVQQVLVDALFHFEGKRTHLIRAVLMPNHVHVLFRLLDSEASLESVIHSWKGFSAKVINRRLGLSGVLWQKGYWDRIVRSEVHLTRLERYIEENPVKAGLAPGDFRILGKRER